MTATDTRTRERERERLNTWITCTTVRVPYIVYTYSLCLCIYLQCSIADVGIVNMDSIVIRVREGYEVGAAGDDGGGGGKRTGRSRSGTNTGQKATAGSKRTGTSLGVVSIADVGTNRKARRVPKKKFPGRGAKLGTTTTDSVRTDEGGGAAVASAEVCVLLGNSTFCISRLK